MENNVDSANFAHRSLSSNDLLILAEGFKGTTHQKTLRKLKLGFNNLSDDGAVVVSKFLSEFPLLECLDLGFNGISDAGAIELSKSLADNATLRLLYLSGNSLTWKGFECFAQTLRTNTTLISLYLTGNSGDVEGARLLSEALCMNSSMQVLFLNGNNIREQGCKYIADMLKCNTTLTHLNLSDNHIGDQGLLYLTEAFQHNRTVTNLEISFNGVTSLGLENLCTALKGCHQLKRLLLDNNKIMDAGVILLADTMQFMSLTELNIGFNEVGTEGLSRLISGLIGRGGIPGQDQDRLEVLVLSGNTISGDVSRLIAHMLVHNTTVHKLYLDHTNIGPVGEKNIAAGIASSKCCGLQVLTGFDLGRVLTTLGSPAQLGACSNESALKYLAEMWRHQRLAEEQQMMLGNAAAAATVAMRQQRRPEGAYGEGGMLMDGTDGGDNNTTYAMGDMATGAGVCRYAATDYNNYHNNSLPVPNQYHYQNNQHTHNNSQKHSIAASPSSMSHPIYTSDPHHHQNNNGSSSRSGGSGDMVGVIDGDAASVSVYSSQHPHSPCHNAVGTRTGTGRETMPSSSSSSIPPSQSSSAHTPRGADITASESPPTRSPTNGSPGNRRVTIMGGNMGGNSSFGSGGSSQEGLSGDSSQAGRSGGSSQGGHSDGSCRMNGSSGGHQKEGLSLNGSAGSGLSNGDMDTCYLSQGAVSLSREDLDDLFEGFSQEAMLKRFSFASACGESFTLQDHQSKTGSNMTNAIALLNGSSSTALATVATTGSGCTDEAEELFALLDSAMKSHPSIANVIDECCTNTGSQDDVVNHMNQLQQQQQQQQQQQLRHSTITNTTPDSSTHVQDSSVHSFNPQNPLNQPHLNISSDGSSQTQGMDNSHKENTSHEMSSDGLRVPGVQGTYSSSDADLSRVIDSLGLASPLKNTNPLPYPEGMLSIGMGVSVEGGLRQNTSISPKMQMSPIKGLAQQEGMPFVHEGFDGFTPSSSLLISSNGMTSKTHASFGMNQQQGQGLGTGSGIGLSLSGREGHHNTNMLTSMTPSSSSSSSSSSSGSGSSSGSRARSNHHTSRSPRPHVRHHNHHQQHQHYPAHTSAHTHTSSHGHPSHHRSLTSTSSSHLNAAASMQSSSDSAGITGVTATAFLWQPELVSTHHPGHHNTRRRPSFMQSAAALCACTFNPADLWELHQYYFSPPEPYLTYKSSSEEHMSVYIRSNASNGSLARESLHHSPTGSNNNINQVDVTVLSRIRSRGSNDFLLSSPTNGDTNECDTGGTGCHRPRKRHGNRNTMARIATYPRIKHQLEVFKTAHNDHGTLKLLRLLRFVEESEEGAGVGREDSTESLVLELCENN